MVEVAVTLACRNYDGTNALIRGRLRPPPGMNLQVIEVNDVVAMFSGMFKGEYDVSEMSLAELVYYSTRDRCDFIGIPVFPSRLFRHGFMLCNGAAGIQGPQDLTGKRIGGLRWVQTAFIWLRGMLAEEHNLRPRDTHWYVSALHHWHEQASEEAIIPRDGSIIRRFTADGNDEYETSCRALLDGTIDLLMTTENRKYDRLAADARARPLFPDAREAEATYFKKTGIMPIMHVLVMRRSMADRHPDLARRLFELFCRAKTVGREWIRSVPSLTLAWKNRYLDEELELFGGRDPWAYGLGENFASLAKFLSYCYAQGVSAREISPYDLFLPDTWELSEQSKGISSS
jgi:4,5-dihydroxyphthalate decarboxylase